MSVKLASVVVVVALFAVAPAGAEPAPVTAGYENPESAYWDAASQQWFVSSLGGFTLDTGTRDGNGYISRMDADGVATEVRWVDGLDSPKGLRSFGGKLYVADIDHVVVVDIASGAVADRVPAPGAGFLNDVAVDDATGDVYATDTFANTIYRLPGGEGPAEVWLQTEALESPNGALVVGDALLVAGFGPNLDPATFQSDAPGRVLAVDLATKAITPASDRIGSLDGIEADGDELLVSSFFDGRIVRVATDGSTTTEHQLAISAADIGFDPDRGLLAVPHLALNVVLFLG